MIYIFFAPGFEEIEGIATLDILRRAELDIKSVSVGGRQVKGAHGISVVCDITEEELGTDDMEMVILPGGMPGTLNLEKSQVVQAALDHAAANDLWIAAICAAPSVLGHKGLLAGKRYTCFPGFEEGIENAAHTGERVVRDGKLITGKGPGCAIDFALELVTCLTDKPRADALRASLQ